VVKTTKIAGSSGQNLTGFAVFVNALSLSPPICRANRPLRGYFKYYLRCVDDGCIDESDFMGYSVFQVSESFYINPITFTRYYLTTSIT